MCKHHVQAEVPGDTREKDAREDLGGGGAEVALRGRDSMEDLARTRWTNPVAKSVGPACVRARVVWIT